MNDPINVGDRVVCIDDQESFGRLKQGEEYTVEAAFDGTPTVIIAGAYHMLERFEKPSAQCVPRTSEGPDASRRPQTKGAQAPFEMTRQQINRLLVAAKDWAAFQEPDSLEDQKTDSRLQSRAIEARERLLAVIDDLPLE
jgi:hypothetical protein